MTSSMARTAVNITRDELVHPYADGFVVARKWLPGLYTGVSCGAKVVSCTTTRRTKRTQYVPNPRPPVIKGAEIKVLSEDDEAVVWIIREESGDSTLKGTVLDGSLGQVAEGGCFYPTREKAEAAAKRWRIIKA